MKTKLTFFSFLLLNILLLDLPSSGRNSLYYNVRDFGAKGDNLTNDSQAIQSAIDQCFRSGGGTVIFPQGTYLSGSIEIKSNIHLQIESGAVIKGSPNLSDYQNMGRTSEGRNKSLIWGIGASNIFITGGGIIDGNDSVFMDWNQIHPECCFDTSYTRQGKDYVNAFPDGPAEFRKSGRPGILICLIECQNIQFKGITIRNAPNWCVHLACCDHAEITGVDFLNSLLVPNADGIDISNCKNIRISFCHFVAGDDGIAISPCADGFCMQETENIHVSDCTITSRSSAIRIGWAKKNIRNCTFRNLVIHSNRGIGIFAKHDEKIENIVFDHIAIYTRLHTGWWGIGEPVHISEIPLGTWYGDPQNLQKSALIRNIRFSNLTIVSENSIFLYGYHPYSLQNIEFSHIRHSFKNSPLNKVRGGNFELRPAFDNRYAVYKHDIPAFYARNVKGLAITHYQLECDPKLPEFYTNAIFCENYSNFRIEKFCGPKLSPNGSASVIYLENGEKATVKNCKAVSGTNVFLEYKNLIGPGTFLNNNLRMAKIPIRADR